MESAPVQKKFLRSIRSFVRRQGHMTAAQRQALDEWWPHYGVELDDVHDVARAFGRRAPLTLEIGFGNGESLVVAASANPHNNYLGVEVHQPGVGQLLRELQTRVLNNVRVVCADANDVLAKLPEGSCAEVCLFFPDPWPKKRHHKRRLLQPAFADAVRRCLALNGMFYLATDWEDYAAHMLAVLSEMASFENVSGPGHYAPRAPQRPVTRFERRGQRLGHAVRDLAFRRVT